MSEYNRRFNEDPLIIKVTEVSTLCSSKRIRIHPKYLLTQYEIELFNRFYEEIELAIKRGLLKTKDVEQLFAYYAIDGTYTYLLVDLYDEGDNWTLLRSFLNRVS